MQYYRNTRGSQGRSRSSAQLSDKTGQIGGKIDASKTMLTGHSRLIVRKRPWDFNESKDRAEVENIGSSAKCEARRLGSGARMRRAGLRLRQVLSRGREERAVMLASRTRKLQDMPV